MDKKLDKLSEEQESAVPTQEPAENKFDFEREKEDIITKIKDEIVKLGRSSDSHFDANKKNIGAIIETIQKVWNIVSRIRKLPNRRRTRNPSSISSYSRSKKNIFCDSHACLAGAYPDIVLYEATERLFVTDGEIL
jgi:hypothetical protein